MARKKTRGKRIKDTSSIDRHVIDIEEAQEERRLRRQQAANEKKRKSHHNKAESAADTVLNVSSEARKKKRKKAGRAKRVLILIMILAVLVFCGGAITQVVKLNIELRETEAERDRMLAEKNLLEKDLTRINDPEYIEEQARKKLRMIRQGEILYVFPENEQSSSD